jgi:BirA family transcriptional regulator, biotin operon repressor / biotin---[acetyl-CoA-carboxylase] ligase
LRSVSRHTAGRNVSPLALKILDVFREETGKIISGEDLSLRLNVSRTAVWKHIKTLRLLGYQIIALPSQGYRLLSSPNILLPEEIMSGLDTSRIGNKILRLDNIGSTNNEAFKLAEEGAEEGTVVIADTQNKGKGRLGREWLSPPGVNIYCSVILRPPILPVSAYQLTFLSAVAVARAVEQTVPLQPRIKWPNDILLNGRKIAGLLNEMSAETEKVNFVILGIGVNLNMNTKQFPDNLRHPASSLMIESGIEVERKAFFKTLIKELDILYDCYLRYGDGPVREEWIQRCDMLGKSVSVSGSGALISGVVTGVDDHGALLVRLPDGSVEQVLSGDVTLV